jgi:hypothetical protein
MWEYENSKVSLSLINMIIYKIVVQTTSWLLDIMVSSNMISSCEFASINYSYELLHRWSYHKIILNKNDIYFHNFSYPRRGIF